MAWTAFDDIVAAVRRTLVFSGNAVTRTNGTAEDMIEIDVSVGIDTDLPGTNDGDLIAWDGVSEWVVRTALKVLSSSVQFGVATVEFASSLTSPVISPATKGASGTTFTIRGQNATNLGANGGRMAVGGGQSGTGGTGGNLDLYSGEGQGGTGGTIREITGGAYGTGTLVREVSAAGVQNFQGNDLDNIGHIDVDQFRTSDTASATTPGNVTDRMPVYDSSGVLVGYVAIYDGIT